LEICAFSTPLASVASIAAVRNAHRRYELGRGNPRLRIDIIQAVRSIDALLHAAPRSRAAMGHLDFQRWKSMIELHQRLLARSTEAHPVNAPSPSAPVSR